MIEVANKKRWKKKRISTDLRAYALKEVVKYKTIESETHEGIIMPEDNVCSIFGCSKKLSLIEKLCGNKCINHQPKNKYSFQNGKL